MPTAAPTHAPRLPYPDHLRRLCPTDTCFEIGATAFPDYFWESLLWSPCGLLLFESPRDKQRFSDRQFSSAISLLLGNDQQDTASGTLAPEPLARVVGHLQFATYLAHVYGIPFKKQLVVPTGYNFEAVRTFRFIESTWERLGFPQNTLRPIIEPDAKNTGDNFDRGREKIQRELTGNDNWARSKTGRNRLHVVCSTDYHCMRLWLELHTIGGALTRLSTLGKYREELKEAKVAPASAADTEKIGEDGKPIWEDGEAVWQNEDAFCLILIPDRYAFSDDDGEGYCRDIVQSTQLWYPLDWPRACIADPDNMRKRGVDPKEVKPDDVRQALERARCLFTHMLTELESGLNVSVSSGKRVARVAQLQFRVKEAIAFIKCTGIVRQPSSSSSSPLSGITPAALKALLSATRWEDAIRELVDKVCSTLGLASTPGADKQALEDLRAITDRIKSVRELADLDAHLMEPSVQWRAIAEGPKGTESQFFELSMANVGQGVGKKPGVQKPSVQEPDVEEPSVQNPDDQKPDDEEPDDEKPSYVLKLYSAKDDRDQVYVVAFKDLRQILVELLETMTGKKKSSPIPDLPPWVTRFFRFIVMKDFDAAKRRALLEINAFLGATDP